MKTYTITGYQAYGACDPSAYFIDISYRGQRVAQFTGPDAFRAALFYVGRNAGRAVINMGHRA